MPTKLDQLKDKLRELFQLDRPDLDFGFYRIMHAKQSEIDRFLDHDLLPQVQAGLATLKGNDSSELTDAIKQAQSLGVDPDTVPKVRDLRAKYGTPVDPAKTEDAIYSHLYRFFSRYYDSGDFISMRRYKEGVYAIPYEGEEVVLHWANKDQYYIKSSENLRDYTVKLAEGDDAPRLHFKLVEADIEKDNRKAADDKKRIFIFNPEKTEVLENEIVLGFEYRADPDVSKQEAAIAACVDYVKTHAADFGPLAPRLLALRPTEKNKDRTLLEKHLSDYTSKNSMDYFIHKDLGGFLHRELDFYIKNEVMHLDDIENETAPRVEQYLAQVRVIRGIAHKLIDFLAQLEDFQKKLWLKKKFVIETNYCITLDRVPEELYSEIAANADQIAEWINLGFVEKSAVPALKTWLAADPSVRRQQATGQTDLFGSSTLGSQPSAFSPYLVLDTAFFDVAFKQKLLASIENIDEQCDGLLIHSENFQALNLLQERYREQVKCVYIDPPYNTDAGPIDYKNGYRYSSWMSLIQSRLWLSRLLLSCDGILCITIDDYQIHELATLLDSDFGKHQQLGTAVIRNNPSGRPSVTGLSVCHEYALFYSNGTGVLERLPRSEEQLQRFSQENGAYVNWQPFRKGGGSVTYRTARPKQYYPIYVNAIGRTLRIPSLSWSAVEKSWNALEQPTADETVILPIDEKGNERIWSFNHVSAIENIHDLEVRTDKSGKTDVYRRHRPADGVIPRSWWDKSIYGAREYGSAVLSQLFSAPAFSFAKSPFAVADCLRVSGLSTGYNREVLDYFAGSGTTGHAVIDLNREDAGNRRYILVEMGEYFDTVLKPRIQKVIYSKDWKDGKPTAPETGISHCFKYIRLESYEDCLNNLELKRTAGQDDLLNRNPAIKEDYTLRYMLDVESRDSLLNPAAFADPYACKLKIAAGSVGETKPVTVDLVETFNYLIGLKVKTMDTIRGVQVITGENLAGEKILVLWRKVAETDSEALNQWFVKQGYNTQDMEFDIIYVNGDNFLENLRKDEQTWKVRLTEEEFLRRMFNEEGGV